MRKTPVRENGDIEYTKDMFVDDIVSSAILAKNTSPTPLLYSVFVFTNDTLVGSGTLGDKKDLIRIRNTVRDKHNRILTVKDNPEVGALSVVEMTKDSVNIINYPYKDGPDHCTFFNNIEETTFTGALKEEVDQWRYIFGEIKPEEEQILKEPFRRKTKNKEKIESSGG